MSAFLAAVARLGTVPIRTAVAIHDRGGEDVHAACIRADVITILMRAPFEA
jgi:hypothetical protein